MSWVGALVIVVAVYLAANFVLRRFGLFSSALSSESLRELIARRDEPPLVLDVRAADEYRTGHVPTAVNIPHDSIVARPPKVPKDRAIVVYCETGSRSLVARGSLRRLGFTNVVNFGPIRRWKEGLIAGPDPGRPPLDESASANDHSEPDRDGK